MKKWIMMLCTLCLFLSAPMFAEEHDTNYTVNEPPGEVKMLIEKDENGNRHVYYGKEAKQKNEEIDRSDTVVQYEDFSNVTPIGVREYNGMTINSVTKKVKEELCVHWIENRSKQVLDRTGYTSYTKTAEVSGNVSVGDIIRLLNVGVRLSESASIADSGTFRVSPWHKGALFVKIPYYEVKGSRVYFINGGGGGVGYIPFTAKIPIDKEISLVYREVRL